MRNSRKYSNEKTRPIEGKRINRIIENGNLIDSVDSLLKLWSVLEFDSSSLMLFVDGWLLPF